MTDDNDGYNPPPNWKLERRMPHGSGIILMAGLSLFLILLGLTIWSAVR